MIELLSFLRFKILNETPTFMTNFSKDEFSIDDKEKKYLHRANMRVSNTFKKISNLKKYEIWKDSNPSFDIRNGTGIISVYDPKKDETHLSVEGYFKGNKFKEEMLQGHPDRKIKAHELFQHLILDHGMELHSSTVHSKGTLKTWEKLVSHPDIEVFHVINKKGRRVSPQDNFSKFYSSSDSSDNTMSGTHFVARRRRIR